MFDIEIDVEVVAPPPIGAPLDFRERLALAIKTTDASVLEAAEQSFRGVWPSVHHYIIEQVAADLPPALGWLLACCDPTELQRRYVAGVRDVWTIPLSDGQAMVFENREIDGKPSQLSAAVVARARERSAPLQA